MSIGPEEQGRIEQLRERAAEDLRGDAHGIIAELVDLGESFAAQCDGCECSEVESAIMSLVDCFGEPKSCSPKDPSANPVAAEGELLRHIRARLKNIIGNTSGCETNTVYQSLFTLRVTTDVLGFVVKDIDRRIESIKETIT